MMNKVNFFQAAPTDNTFRKRIMEAIFQRQNVIGCFPMDMNLLPIYSLPALSGEGLVIAVCPDQGTIQRNLKQLKASGASFPEIAVLDGYQMPHEEREVLKLINHHKIQLLYTTPEHFGSLNFMQMLLHAPVRFVVIEEAHNLLPGFSSYSRYAKLLEGLSFLKKKPPLVLLGQLLVPSKIKMLKELLGLNQAKVFEISPSIDMVSISVKKLFTEYQKFKWLCQKLTETTDSDKIGKILDPGSVLISAKNLYNAEKLANSLYRFGFYSVYQYHSGLSEQDQAHIEKAFRENENAIVITVGQPSRIFQPPTPSLSSKEEESKSFKIVFWDLPYSIDEVFCQLFRYPDEHTPASVREVEGLFLYTKEDYKQTYKQIFWKHQKAKNTYRGSQHRQNYPFAFNQRVEGLVQLRRWVLSDFCRFQALIAFWKGGHKTSMVSCGQCDRCKAPPKTNLLNRLMQKCVDGAFY